MGVAVIRRVAAALLPVVAAGALLAGPAEAKRKPRRAAKAKAPVVTRVTPMEATLGATLTVSGRHFRTGAGRNRVGFKAAGQPAIYLRAGRATSRTIKVTLTDALAGVVGDKAKPFRLRVVTSRFGKRYTSDDTSPTIGPVTAGGPATGPGVAGPPAGAAAPGAAGSAAPGPTCAARAGDQDGDLLPDDLERRIGTDVCSPDSDADGVRDGFEYRSAVDFNDDEYQAPNSSLPYPGKVPYPNPLDGTDAGYDFDGDLLTLSDEYRLWQATTPPASRTLADQPPRATPLSYSDGLQDSLAVRCPAAGAPTCTGQNAGRAVSTPYDAFEPFYTWAQAHGYATVMLDKVGPFKKPTSARRAYDIRDVDLSGRVTELEADPLDYDGDGLYNDDRLGDDDGLHDDGERDADADGLSNYDELHGRMTSAYWDQCYGGEPNYGLPFTAPDPTNADTDGDGVRDGADDTDRDEVPNVMELSRIAASPFNDRAPGRGFCVSSPDDGDRSESYGWVQPYNPCMPIYSIRCSAAYVAAYPGPIWWALQ